MATTIAAQLQAIKSSIQIESDPNRRPFTRPSIIFDPKEAADIDVETILSIALTGLEDLIGTDARFESYKNSLFSQKSQELDREIMGVEENKRIDASVSSYLRLLAGYLHLRAGVKTLEYLIRRYKVHVYNIDELLLCSLPYHDSPTFVRIVQLLEFRNDKWHFLEGVRVSGAPPPRKVIVQQCIRDKGVLEALCNYASPTKRFHQSMPVIGFCTAVIVEALGAVPTLDPDIVNRVIPFLFDGLDLRLKGGSDHKAGAMMIAGLLASRATLPTKVVHGLIMYIARIAHQNGKESADLPLLRLSVMTIITLVQSESVQQLPKRCLDILKEIRDLPGVLRALSKEFNIDRFLSVYLEALVDNSSSDDSCRFSLITTIEMVNVKDFVVHVVVKVLGACMKLSKDLQKSKLLESGSWAKQILVAIDKNYPTELRGAVRKFLEDPEVSSMQEDSLFNTLHLMLDGNTAMPTELSHSKIWFTLEHPKAEVRRASLLTLASSGLLDADAIGQHNLINVQEAMLRRLCDEDLTVVHAALSVDGLSCIIDPHRLIKAFQDLLSRCIDIVISVGSFGMPSQVFDVAVSCLEYSILNFKKRQFDFSKEVATMIFPLLLILPKTWRLSIKALDLVKEIAWPFFATLCNVYDPISASQVKKFEPGLLNSINTKIVGALAESFLTQPGKYMPWLIECCSSSSLSKPLFLLVLLQSFMLQKDDVASFSSLFQVCFPVLKSEWCEMEGDIVLSEEFDFENPDQTCSKVLDQLFNSNYEALNSTVLVWIYWSILKAFTNLSLLDTSADFGEWQRILQDLFVFSVTSPLKHVYKEQHHLLVMKSGISPVKFLSIFFADEGFSVAVQATSLESFATICSLSASSKKDSLTSCSRMQLLHGFPLVLVALSSNNQDIRMSALNCIEGLYKLWCSISNMKSGNETVLEDEFGQFMELIVDYRKLISSDVNFLPSFLTSVLGSSSNGLFAPQNTDKRFNQCAKENILHFILSYSVGISAYGKLKILSLLKGVGNAIMHVEEVKKLLIELLERRSHHHVGLDRSCEPLSQIEIETLCVILECCFSLPSSFQVGDVIMEHVFRALQVDGASSEDTAIIRPCLTVLKALTPALYNSLKTDKQDELFQDLIILHRNDNGDIQNAARDALLQINVRFSSVSQLLDLILAQDVSLIGSSKGIKKKKSAKHRYSDLLHALSNRGETMLSFLGSLLDVLLQKKDIERRACLVEPLFKLLGKIFKDKWLDQFVDGQSGNEDPSNISHIIGSVCYVQQAALMILEDICASLSSNCPVKDDILDKFDVTLLVDFARSAKDATTRNHVFLLLSSVAKLNPDQVLDNIIDIFTLIGESAIMQSDSYSQHVFKGLLSTVVPCWLSKTNNAEKLLQIFVNVLPEVAEHRRLTLVVYLLRTLGENNSLGTLLVLLLRSLVLRISKPCLDGSEYVPASYSSIAHSEWEYVFAVHICEQYSCTIWLPSLVTLLKEIGMSYQCQEKITELLLTVQLILHKLQDIELVFKLESEHDRDDLQKTLGALMEQIVSHLQVVNFRSKQLSTPASVGKELKERMHIAIKTITDSMTPSAYFKTITLLLGHADGSIRKKALGILCEAVKGYGMVRNKRKETQKLFWKANSGFHMDGSALESFNEMCLEIVQLIDGSVSNSDATVKLAAISSLEVLANKFSSHNAIFVNCLTSVAKHIGSDDLAISSSCLRSTGALVHVLGLEALPELTHVMVHMLTRAHDVSSCSSSKFKISGNSALSGPSINKESLLLSILVTLEAVIDKLGGFLNPYLVDIIDLLVIHSEYVSESDARVKTKADSLRRLVTEKIPVRLILNPLLNIYPEAVMHGESSLSVAFEMLASTISTMDRSSVGSFHAKIFEQCLLALDLRRQHPVSITNIDVVEQSVIHAIIALTMKLTETMFRPIFIRCLEWAESGSQESELCTRNLDRSISFFKLVDKLAEKNRSLFVPYFKYLLEGCTRNLTDDNYKPSIASTQKRKKAKVLGAGGTKEMEGVLSPSQWHLRALILSSLNKCFVYDTGNLKFLDSLNFQVLLKPIVSQLAAEPPETLEHLPNLPTVNEVDDILVCCLGQMAVTAGSDLLWKPLNHEVLMQTRSGKLRTMILSLRVVKYLIEHLKEEYVVLLPETIPFLGELLEDVNLPVRTMAQEILKELETLSGEDLKQYLR